MEIMNSVKLGELKNMQDFSMEKITRLENNVQISKKNKFRKGLLEDLASRADSHSGKSEKKKLLLSHLCFFCLFWHSVVFLTFHE